MVSIKYIFTLENYKKYELRDWADFCGKKHYIKSKTGIVINDTKQAELLSIEAVQNT